MTEPTLTERADAWLRRHGRHLTQCRAWHWNAKNEPELARDRHGHMTYPPTFDTGKPCTCGMVREFWDIVHEAAGAGTPLR